MKIIFMKIELQKKIINDCFESGLHQDIPWRHIQISDEVTRQYLYFNNGIIITKINNHFIIKDEKNSFEFNLNCLNSNDEITNKINNLFEEHYNEYIGEREGRRQKQNKLMEIKEIQAYETFLNKSKKKKAGLQFSPSWL